jgi:hypothetical protein
LNIPAGLPLRLGNVIIVSAILFFRIVPVKKVVSCLRYGPCTWLPWLWGCLFSTFMLAGFLFGHQPRFVAFTFISIHCSLILASLSSYFQQASQTGLPC